MNRDEALKVAEIAQEADGGCPVCSEHLMILLHKAFPDQDWALLFAECSLWGYRGQQDEQAKHNRKVLAEQPAPA
jgi:hypothetical protein